MPEEARSDENANEGVLGLVQDFRSGELALVETPAPLPKSGFVLVRNAFSLISPGTERATIAFAKKSLIGKALARKDLLKKVITKVRRDGLLEALKGAFERLAEPLPLGYSCAGTVIEAPDCDEFAAGDRVACAGAGLATHSEIVCVPRNLVVSVPEGCSSRDAASVALGAIALEAVRVADLRLGESVVVVGLGLMGALVAQMARAAGCRTFALEPRPERVEIVRRLGVTAFQDADALRDAVRADPASGADAVIIAAATPSNQPVETAPQFLRRRGRVVVLGDVGMNVPRRPYYFGEHEIRFSCSYGPGRYERAYETHGAQYPLEHVRWDERRNMAAYLALLADGAVDLEPLLETVVPVRDAPGVYERLDRGEIIAAAISYPRRAAAPRVMRLPRAARPAGGPKLGLVGAGAFARTVLLPRFLKLGATPHILCSQTPARAEAFARRFGFARATTDPAAVVESDCDFLVVATPHSTHADLLVEAIRAGKPTFCEKPLAVDRDGLERVVEAYVDRKTPFQIGFNRRFSEACRRAREKCPPGAPAMLVYLVNAGAVESASWIADPAEGGRVAGEACHFIDTLRYLTGADATEAVAFQPPQSGPGTGPRNETAAVLRFSDDSVGQILYCARGGGAAPKERIEIHRAGRTVVIDDFRSLVVFHGRRRRTRLSGDKGHTAEIRHFMETLAGKHDPTPLVRSALQTTAATLAVIEAARSKAAVVVPRVSVGDASP